MLTVGAPWASAGEDVPGALPAGVYVAVHDDGRELALVRLDLDDGPHWVTEGDAGWTVEDLVDADALPAFVVAALGATTPAALVAQITDRSTWGISPFGEGG